MLLEVYADVVSPLSYVGKRRLKAALDLLPPQIDPPTIRWRPHLVDRTAPSPSVELGDPPDPVVDGLLHETEPGLDAGIRRIEVKQAAIEEGIGGEFGARWRASSWGAHRLLTAAADRDPPLQDQVLEDLLHAHLVDGEDVGSLRVLGRIADRYRLPAPIPAGDTGAALAFLQAGVDPEEPIERATREGQLIGEAIGVTSSPSFVVADRIVLAGLHPVSVLADTLAGIAVEPPEPIAEEVRRFRHARTLLEACNPLGCLYLLAPLRPEYDGQRGLEILTARALSASASLGPAREKLEALLERYPDDAYLHLLMGKTLKRLGDDRSARHLALASAMNPEYLDF